MISREHKVLPKFGIQIRKKEAIFDLDKLYSEIKAWFKDNEYKFFEREQTVKELAKGREITLKWEAERKVDEYAQYNVKIHFFFEKLNKINGYYKGDIKITFYAIVLLDYQGRWQTNPLYKFLFFVYNNYIIKRKIIDVYEARLYKEHLELNNLTKDIIGLIKE